MQEYVYDPEAIVIRGGKEFKAKDCPTFRVGDYWQLNDGGTLVCTIEEKAKTVSHVDGIVSLGRDPRQSKLRVQAIKEMMEDKDLGDTLLAIHPTHINAIMGDIPTPALAYEDVRKAGYEVALEFLKKLPKYYDLSKEDEKKMYLLVLNAEVAAIEDKFKRGIFEITYPHKTYSESEKEENDKILEELKERVEKQKVDSSRNINAGRGKKLN